MLPTDRPRPYTALLERLAKDCNLDDRRYQLLAERMEQQYQADLAAVRAKSGTPAPMGGRWLKDATRAFRGLRKP